MLLCEFKDFFSFLKFRMPWQGHADNLIDRFDVRAHLDIIPEYNSNKYVVYIV